MEALQLFSFQATPSKAPRAAADPRAPEPPDDARWHETELFLAERLERDGDLAQIQAALALCTGTGAETCRSTLDALAPDRGSFPRSANAVERVSELLERPPAERPEGFWPRFLLEQFDQPAER